ncbi:MAG: hypothetical protein PUJ35_04090 [Ruminococcus bromii]|nr:hypothetical protein [Ruminococcus bromii]
MCAGQKLIYDNELDWADDVCTGGFSVHAALYGAKIVEAVARPRRQPQLRPGPVSEGRYPADRMNP